MKIVFVVQDVVQAVLLPVQVVLLPAEVVFLRSPEQEKLVHFSRTVEARCQQCRFL